MDYSDVRNLNSYSIKELQDLIDKKRDDYAVIRLVDPEECREVVINDDGNFEYGTSCYKLWGSCSHCKNCTSFRACRTNCEQDRREKLGEQPVSVRSIPVRIHSDDTESPVGADYFYTLELIREISDDKQSENSPAHSQESIPGRTSNSNPEHPENSSEISPKRTSDNENYLLLHDMLTGCANGDGIRLIIRYALQENLDQNYVMVLTDIRRFSIINDLYGKHRANQLLIHFADILRKAYPGAPIGRIRADQFVLFIKEDQYDPDRLESLFVDLEAEEGKVIKHIHVHAGVLRVGEKEHELPVATLIDRANLAIQSAKESEKLHVIEFSQKMLHDMLQEQFVISNFQTSLEKGEFQIFLQPKVRLDGSLAGAEALTRWIRPDGQILSPAVFIPPLEKSDLITSLDFYICHQVVRKLDSWKGTVLEHCPISVNISPKDAYYIEVADLLEQLCEEYQVPKDLLHVEITETGLIETLDSNINVIQQLKNRGFQVEIDDFGKGLSSLNMLQHIDADILKIDMGFLRNTTNEDRRNIILESVIQMSRKLGMEPLTEGVETEEQAMALHDMGCYLYQGFYYSKPIPISEFEKHCMNRKAAFGKAQG
jgi:EAL domain-containing protein (putative c-di-GMP-specific phosphodiesterase class I)/GGDEF domain-containing protein